MRLGRVERLLLAVLAAASFMFVASTTAPGLQRIAAPIACPTDTTATYVVRVPHVESPSDAMRNAPLFCVRGTTAVQAAEWKTIGTLFAVGFLLGCAVLLTASGLRRIRTRAGREEGIPGNAVGRLGQPAVAHRPMTALRIALLLAAAITAPIAATFAWAWLALDVPYRRYACRSTRGGPATCFDGEPVFRLVAQVCVAATVLLLVLYARSLRRHAAHHGLVARLWREGVEGRATLVAEEATRTKVNGTRIRRFTYELQPAEGQEKATLVVRGAVAPVSAGGTVRALYDRVDPTQFIVLAERATTSAGARPIELEERP